MASTPAKVSEVTFQPGFWSTVRLRMVDKSIPGMIDVQKREKHWDCLSWKHGHPINIHPFWDSDVYKTIEAASYFLQTQQDPWLMEVVEEAVDMIRSAQHPDGYINAYYTVTGMKQRWTNLRDMHELYCLGHLFEACVAYETLTRSGRLLEVAQKATAHVNAVFGEEAGKKRGYPGHQEIEVGLMRLYEMTSDRLYLKVAQFFIYERGQRDANGEIYFDSEAYARGGDPYTNLFAEMKPWYRWPRDYAYHQADCPIVEETSVKGHAVRAMYYYTAATDLVRVRDDSKLRAALLRLWRDMVDTKLYVTGGLGAVRQWEGFGDAYFLNDTEEEGTCYTETCATFGMILWCQRLLRLEPHSEYADVMEIGLYNSFLGSIGSTGVSFNYENPLRTYTGRAKKRVTWFEVACCPPNIAKLLGLLGSLIYSWRDDTVFIHLYISSTFRIPDSDSVVVQSTEFPWSGAIQITISGEQATLALRIPSWSDSYDCTVSGEVINGYLFIRPAPGETVILSFPLRPYRVYAHPRTGKDEVCIMRGPLVYCIEDVDNTVDVDKLALTDDTLLEGHSQSIAGVEGVIPIKAQGRELCGLERSMPLYSRNPWRFKADKVELTFIPFFLRANRGGLGGMRTWLRRVVTS